MIIKIDFYYLGEEVKDDQMKTLNSPEFQLRQEDEKTQDSASELPINKDFESLFDEQEKFYKTEISRKDDENLQLMIENEKIQQQVQNLKEKRDEGRLGLQHSYSFSRKAQ
jgi:hypothetical protein